MFELRSINIANNTYRAYSYAIAAVILWATSASAAAFLKGMQSPSAAVFLFQLFGLIALVIYFATRGLLSKFISETLLALRRHNFVWILLFFALFITLYHNFFYSAIQSAQNKLHANAINYLWPIILTLLTRDWKAPRGRTGLEIVMVFLSFLGVIAIVYEQGSITQFSLTTPLVQAGLAAIFAPIYMILSVKLNTKYYSDTTFGYAAALLVSVPATSLLVFLGVIHIQASMESLPFLIYAGVFTLIMAHVFWTKALSISTSVSITNFSYFVPILSTILLFIFFGQNIGAAFLVGASLVIMSNIITNRLFDFHIAEGTAVAVFFFLCYAIFFRGYVSISATTAVNFAPDVLAILSGFLLIRMWEKARAEQAILGRLGIDIGRLMRAKSENAGGEGGSTKELGASLIRKVSEFDYNFSRGRLLEDSQEIQTRCDQFIDSVQPGHSSWALECGVQIRKQLAEFVALRLERTSSGEWWAVFILACTMIASMYIDSGKSVFQDMIYILVSSAIIYITFKIRDYNNKPAMSDIAKIVAFQAPLKELGTSFYLPGDYALRGVGVPKVFDGDFSVREKDGKIQQISIEEFHINARDVLVGRILLIALIMFFAACMIIALFMQNSIIP